MPGNPYNNSSFFYSFLIFDIIPRIIYLTLWNYIAKILKKVIKFIYNINFIL